MQFLAIPSRPPLSLSLLILPGILRNLYTNLTHYISDFTFVKDRDLARKKKCNKY